MKKHLAYLSLTLLIYSQSWSAITLKGDLDSGEESFSFPISQFAYDEINRTFFVGALNAIPTDGTKKFAISVAGPASDQMFGLTPEIVTLNNVPDTNNPLFGQGISLLGLAGGRPLAVPKNDETLFYLIHNFRNPDTITEFVTPQLRDAQINPEVTAGILALTGAEVGRTEEQTGATFMFAAVKNSLGFWGQPGAGISLARFITQDNQSFHFDIPNAVTGESNGNRAFPLDPTTPAVFIENPVETIAGNPILHWNERLRLLYIGLNVSPSGGPEDGARSVVLGFLTNTLALTLQTVVPDSAIQNTTSIVGSRGATFPDGTVIAHNIKSLYTSTNLDYLIVNGGNGIENQNQVFALPLVNFPSSEFYGKIADKNQEPVNDFHETVASFRNRYLKEVALTPEQMPQTTDIAAIVGGGVLPGLISDTLFSFGDTVFVAASTADNQQAGIFYSQAIFKANGMIASWTPWQRAGATGSIFGFALDALVGDYFFITGATAQTIKTVKRTLNGVISLSSYISEQLPQEIGGAQGLVNLPYTTPGFTTTIGNRLSLLLIPGFTKVLLIQNGADTDDNFGPISPDYNATTFMSNNGSLENFVPGFPEVAALAISDGVLTEIGPIITGGVYVIDNNGYFVVAGFGGIAILCNPDGTGFDATTGLASGFVGLTSTMRFQNITNLIDVRKIIIDGDFLYAVTRTSLERISITPESLATNSSTTTPLAVIGGFIPNTNASLSDGVIYHGFGILATSLGVYFSTPTINLGTATEDQVQWQHVTLNESLNSSTRLFPVLATTTFDGIANVYVLDACVSLNQARLYRLEVDKTQTIPIRPFDDLFMKDIPTFLVSIGAYRNYFATDGAINMITRSKYLANPVIYELLPPHLRSGVRDQQKRSFMINLNIPQSRAIGPMVRSTTSGSWLIVGDFGIRGNE